MEGPACPACGSSCPAGARFCPSCGVSLDRVTQRRASGDERRIVTTLFCDLVGFTALSEQADPEDVDALLRPYYAEARHTIEQYGGVVEKFVGDAVVGVFGVPAAHEDDAERAVRAAVVLQERIADLPPLAGRRLQARVGVNTGDALVRLGVDPGSGEAFLVGDAINTASRLQAVAPPGGIVVSETTKSVAAEVTTYEGLGTVRLKGKRELLRPYLVTGRGRSLGMDLRRSFASRLVGREVELGILTGMFDKAVASNTPQIAFIVADAGLGKSRLLHEVARWLDERPDVIAWWRQAQCPAFGEGLSLWPLAQILREHARIREGDDVASMETKLQRMLAGDPDREWLAARLRPLLGLPAPAASKEENFAAWLRFLELMARTKPTVLVFEDVQWASPLMVEFLWYVVARIDDVPLLGIGTARPEFLQAYPDYNVVRAADAMMSRALQIDLHPLSPPETHKLVGALTAAHELRGVRATIADRCGGNPLYAEELVRLLHEHVEDHGMADQALDEVARHELSMSLHALIASRLDTLKPDLKAVLADAAVIGQRFWPGALVALSGRERDAVEEALQELSAREFVRPGADKSAAGERDVVFWHSLTQDVLYRQLTREARARKHEAVAEWLRETSAGRLADSAPLIARHYMTALELRRALDDGQAARLVAPAVSYAAMAGEAALAMDVAAAERFFESAVRTAPADLDSRPSLLLSWAAALHQAGRTVEALERATEAVESLRDRGDGKTLARAMALAASYSEFLGHRATRSLEEALRIAEAEPPSTELLQVLEVLVASHSVRLEHTPTLAYADRALALSERLQVPPPARVVHYRGASRCDLGDERGLEEMERALQMARADTSTGISSTFTFNYAEQLLRYHGPRKAAAAVLDGIDLAARRGDAAADGYLSLALLRYRWLLGEWRSLAEQATVLRATLAARSDTLDVAEADAFRAMVQLITSRDPVLPWEQPPALEGATYQYCLGVRATLHAARGEAAEAKAQLRALTDRLEVQAPDVYLIPTLPELARALVTMDMLAALAGAREQLRLPCRLNASASASLDALDLESGGLFERAAGRFEEAARSWEEAEVPYERAHALFGLARCLGALDRREAAEARLGEADRLFTRLGAPRAVDACKECALRLARSAR